MTSVPCVTFWSTLRIVWITRGKPIWGRGAALKRFETLHQGTWKLNPDRAEMRVIILGDTSAQLFVPNTFNIGAKGSLLPIWCCS